MGATLSLAAPASADEQAPAADDWILFRSYRPDLEGSGIGQWEVVRPDGTERTVLADAASAVWSADGRLVYLLQRATPVDCVSLLQSFTPDGRFVGELQLPAADQAFRPSPDGRRFVFLRAVPGQDVCPVPSAGVEYDVWVMDVDGTNQRLLADNGTDPAWSPDGRHVVMVEYADGADQAAAPPNMIVVRDLEGARRVLVDGGAAGALSSPRWSPDGSHVAYQAWGQDGWALHVVAADGGTPVALPVDQVASEAAWSPDSSQLAVSVEQGPARVVKVVAADGMGVTQLTPDGYEDIDPAWSPDGSRLALVRIGPDDRALTIVTVRDGAASALFDANDPEWRPRPSHVLPDVAMPPNDASFSVVQLAGLALMGIAVAAAALRRARARH